jgi:hypothetical protein
VSKIFKLKIYYQKRFAGFNWLPYIYS